jgi:predicted permease
LLRWHPREFRARYGEEIEAALARASAEGVSASRLVGDALMTLFRSWRDRLGSSGSERRAGWQPSEWVRDVRFALRGLLRDRLHAMVAVLTLALAIGANAAVFSVAYSVLLRTLPYEAPERTVRVEPSPVLVTGNEGFRVSRTLTELPYVESASAFTEDGSASLQTGTSAEPVRVTHVDGRFFEVLGARLQLGRPVALNRAEGAEVVLSHGLWQRSFGSDRSVLGRTIHLTGHAVTVVGVAAPGVSYPSGTDIWLSYPVLFDLMGAASGGDVIARISRPELIAQTRDLHAARVRAEWESQGDTFPAERDPELIPLRGSMVGPVGDSLILLWVASALVLVLGCVNLAGLYLARHASRAGEFAMRRALGAGKLRLVRMILIESTVVAFLAGALALAFVVWGRALLTRLLVAELPGLDAGAPGIETLAFIALLALVTGLLVGIIPALQFWMHDTMHPASGRMAERRRRMHPVLVLAQVALAVVLVVSAGLLGRSVISLRSVHLGFDTEHVFTFEARLPAVGRWDTAAFHQFADDVRSRLAGQPGIHEVGVTSRLPLSDGIGVAFRVWPAARPETTDERVAVAVQASSTYFDALGIRLLAGTSFAPDASAAGTVIVSRSTAEQLFGRIDVVGENVRVRTYYQSEPVQATIAGVVDDVRPDGFLHQARRTLYFPFHLNSMQSMAFAIRSDRSAGDVFAMIRQVVRDVDPTVAPFAVRSMRDAASATIATRDALALISGLFGTAALLLAGLGIYGLTAQSVIRRGREMGIRLAVGARAGNLLGMVLRGALALALAGTGIGLIVSLVATRLLRGFLFGVGATDPVTFAAVAVIALVATAAASLGPAARAARTDPMTSLRTD